MQSKNMTKVANIGKGVEPTDKVFLQAKFDQLVEDYDHCVGTREFDIREELSGAEDVDDITLNNIRYETSKHLRSFLEAGFDANIIVKMLSCEDVWKHYDALKSHGAKQKTLKRKVLDYLILEFEYGKDEEILNNFITFYERGIGFTTLLSNISVGYGDNYQYDGRIASELEEKMTYERLLSEGVDEKTAKELAEKYQKYME